MTTIAGAQQMGEVVSTLEVDGEFHSQGNIGGVAVDRLGFVYTSNFYDAVWRISPNGKVKQLTEALYGSSGNTIDAQGNLFQANFLGNNIMKIDRLGNVEPFLEEGLNGPVGMVFDKKGNLYVTNCNGNYISKITPKKEVTTLASGSLFACPNGITTDANDNLYIVNFNDNNIIKIENQGEPSILTSLPGIGGNAHIAHYNSNFYVTKIKDNNLYKVSSSGESMLYAGSGKTTIEDGPALEASLARPNGIAIDQRNGTIYANNLDGEWNGGKPAKLAIRKIKIRTVSDLVSELLYAGKTEDAKKAFWDYVKNPFNKAEDVGPSMGALGWQFMRERRIGDAIVAFSLMSEKYPDRWRAWYYLGDVYKIIGQNEQAVNYLKKALELDPDNALVLGKLKEIEG